ncbi:MAG: hypothetical protein HF314_00115 [Ignavibacteria bacterium]|nr:hypothetical protein [Ignavibacteria bacterium]MCU7501454.1 hypothetical protein [Ignavibacteria bacterium]MCU7516030.1 hypothetical protein [Ignavibacteria bacterium]
MFAVELKNTKRDTLGAVFIGKFRRSFDTTAIGRSIHDCILEVKQNGILRRSTDLKEIEAPYLGHEMPVLHKFIKDSSTFVIIRYVGDMRKYFHLNSSSYSVRVLLIPEELNVKLYKKLYKEQYIQDFQNVKLITDTVKTPFVSID